MWSWKSIVRAVLVDAGPLAAFLDRSDPDHEATLEAMSAIRGEARTVWPAVVEACHLLDRKGRRGADALLDILAKGAIKLSRIDAEDIPHILRIRRRFGDRRLDLTDAALTRALERDDIDTLMTLDERDFRPIERAYAGRFKLVVPKKRR
jgi:predicted nucleic acid-binding protein